MEVLIGLIIFVVDIWAIVQTLQSPVSAGTKTLWVVVIFLLPVLGLILWFFLGPRTVRA